MGNFARRRRHPIAGADEGVVVTPPDGDWFRAGAFLDYFGGGGFGVEPATVNLSMAASASFDYDPLQYTHKMAWDWTAASDWGTPPDYVPRQIGFVTASGTSAGSAVYSILDNEHTKGIRINAATGELYCWFDRELLNACLGPTRTFDVTATVGATSRSTAVTVNLDISDYATSVGLNWNVPGISSRCGVDPATTLTPFPAYGGPYPSGWTMVENTYSSFVAGVYTTGLKWYEIRPTGNGSTLTDYDCSGFAFRNPSNYTNIEVTNCLFDGSVWGDSPLTNSSTATITTTAGSPTVSLSANISVNGIVVGNPNIPDNTYVIARTPTTGTATSLTLSAPATGSGTVSTNFYGQSTGTILLMASGSTATVTFTDCTFDAKGDEYPWRVNILETRHPNQSFINCKFIDFANDAANTNGGTFTDCYMACIGTNNRFAFNKDLLLTIPAGQEGNQGDYWGHCDGIQSFNTNANLTITRCYADLRWYHVDPMLEIKVAGATAAFFMENNTTGEMIVQDSISRGGTYGVYARTGGTYSALTIYRDCLFDADNNLGQVATTARPQLQAVNNKFLLDWIARDDASQPVGGGTSATSGSGIPTYYKGDDYGFRTNSMLYHPTNFDLNPDIVAPAGLAIETIGPDYVRFSFTRQNNTTYEARYRTTVGPGSWSSWSDLEDQSLRVYVPGGSASPLLAASTAYDFEVRGYNGYCVTTGGVRLLADGPAGSVSGTTTAALSADADAAAIIAAWTTAPTVYEKHAVYNLVASLKAGANAWAQLGHLFCASAGNTSALSEQRSLFNWCNPATTYTKSATSPAWRAQYGGGVSAGGAGAEYIRSGWKPGYGGDTLASQNDISLFRYMVATDGNPSNVMDMGNVHNGLAANNGTNMRFRSSANTDDAPTTSANPYIGMLLVSRDNASDYDVYFSVPSGTLAAISGSPITRTSTTPGDSELVFLGQNTTTGGISITRSSRGYMGFMGGGKQMTLTQGQELQDAIEAFLDWFDALPT